MRFGCEKRSLFGSESQTQRYKNKSTADDEVKMESHDKLGQKQQKCQDNEARVKRCEVRRLGHHPLNYVVVIFSPFRSPFHDDSDI